jgi:hypothetical protein
LAHAQAPTSRLRAGAAARPAPRIADRALKGGPAAARESAAARPATSAREIVAKFRLVGNDPSSLLDLDRELGSRSGAE